MTRRGSVRKLLPNIFSQFISLRFTEAIAEEAILAFELNMGLFTTLRPPSNSQGASSEPARAPLGNPSLPPTPPPESVAHPNGNGTVASTGKYSPLQTNITPRPPKLTERSFSVSSVAAIALAAALTHFILVVAGFTGASGYFKLEAMWNWIGERVSRL